MRKLLLGLVLGALLAPLAARADHVSEPTHPIIDFKLVIEDYAGTQVIDCAGDVAGFRKFRVSPIAYYPEEAFRAGDPSEHFGTGVQIDRRVISYKGIASWTMEERWVWDHQNIGPHNGASKLNTAYATIAPGEPNGGSSSVLRPGTYRVTAELLGTESGNYFRRVCTFTVI